MRRRATFNADWQCVGCPAILHVDTYLAVVQGTGYQYECPTCHQLYLVKHAGVVPISEPVYGTHVDAIGEPYEVPPFDPGGSQ